MPTPLLRQRFATLALFAALLPAAIASAHPAGGMIAIGEIVLWPCVSPVGDRDHHACVMTWSEAEGAKTWLVSEHPASDWMFAPGEGGSAYLIERRFDHAIDNHRFRLLRGKPGEDSEELWPWREDPLRVGEAGFAMLSDEEMLFARYPSLYKIEKGGEPVEFLPGMTDGARSMRDVGDGRLLLRFENEFRVMASSGLCEATWSNILVEEPWYVAPFGGNMVFDADFAGGQLWLAYWGRRRFDRLDLEGNRATIHQLESPWLPHGVAAVGGRMAMLASSLDGAPEIRPRLWIWDGREAELIWDGEE